MSTCSRDWSRAGEAEVREVPCKADVLIQEHAGEELEGGSDHAFCTASDVSQNRLPGTGRKKTTLPGRREKPRGMNWCDPGLLCTRRGEQASGQAGPSGP